MSWRLKSLAGVIFAIGLADAALKAYALKHFPEEQAADLGPVLSLALHRNPGIAFDIPLPLAIVIPLTLAVCAVFLRLIIVRRHSQPEQALAAWAAVVGSLGNAGDRLIHGFTTDYLIIFRTSAINLSDILILAGILAVLWYDKRIPSQATETQE
jgi:lipoprotein signal peptidase